MNDRPADTPPDHIAVPGQPVRTTANLRLEAVGQDWDGAFKPDDAITYHPPTRPR